MHEMSLAENVLQLIEDSARTQQFKRVRSVVLEIGKLSSVEPDAMRFCFEAVVAGSIAQGARLDIIETEGLGWCASCLCHVPLAACFEPCPLCGNYQISISGGDAMRVKELEVE
jgi:hydrogenase nickel incorporation protein HypA/HybF